VVEKKRLEYYAESQMGLSKKEMTRSKKGKYLYEDQRGAIKPLFRCSNSYRLIADR